jgi:2-polyprenyl-3-methyl-5-hydroxy-6-metoxy-1,4-benzoquinol methylase
VTSSPERADAPPRARPLQALGLYRGMPLQVRVHTRLRAWTCPLRPLLERLPAGGRLLDVGCGHGLFANEAAARHRRLDVLGIDPSGEKIRWAEPTAEGRPNVRFRCERVEELGEDGFDVLSVLDVLYLVPRAGWAAFLRSCHARLRPGGRLLLKEVDVQPRWKFYRCLAQEAVSVRLLGITLGGAFAFASRGEMAQLLAEAGFGDVRVTDLGAGYLTPHVLYEAQRA